MDFQANSVTQAVDEVTIYTGFFENLMRGFKNLFGWYFVFYFGDGYSLGFFDKPVGFCLCATCFPDKNGPGKIGAIILEFCPEVKKQGVTFFNFAIACFVMGQCGVGAGGYNRFESLALVRKVPSYGF